MKTSTIYLLIALSFTAVISFSAKVNGQQNARFLHFSQNPYLFNPAYAGKGENIKAFLHYRNEMAGLRGAPNTSLVSIDAPIKKLNFGLGFQVFNDQVSLIHRQGFNGTYAYNFKLNEDQNLSVGLNLGYYRVGIDQNEIVADNPQEVLSFFYYRPLSSFNSDFGLVYQWKDLEIGASAAHLLTNKSSDDPQVLDFNQEETFYFTSRYTYDINSTWTAIPSVIVRSSIGLPVQFDLNALAKWNNLLWGGLSYSYNANLGVTVGIDYEGLNFGYAYQYPLSTLNNISMGSHELVLGINLSKVDPNAYKKTATPNRKIISDRKRNPIDTTVHIVVYDVNKEANHYKRIMKEENILKDEIINQELKTPIINKVETGIENSNNNNSPIPNQIEKSEEIPVNNPKPSSNNTSKNTEEKINQNKARVAEEGELHVVLGTFSGLDNALGYQKLIQREMGINTEIIMSKNKDYFLVTSGKLESLEQSETLKTQLVNNGLNKFTDGKPWSYRVK